MFTIIDSLNKLKRSRKFIDSLFSLNGKIFLQNYLSLEAKFRSNKKDNFVVFIDDSLNLISAFEKKSEKVWLCSLAGYPILAKNNVSVKGLENFVNKIFNGLKVDALYFPLVYRKDKIYLKLKSLSGISTWPRLPSPIIKKNFSGTVIWDKVKEHYGSRAEKQKNKFEKYLYIRPIKINEVENIIRTVENNSWKKLYGQDMISRGDQYKYYVNIIKNGLADISVCFDRKTNQPVAFRIDSLNNGILYTIKWSFDENYKKYSPGFYLITIDLFHKYLNTHLNYIDLYGSPDSLKNMVETNRLSRCDFCLSKSNYLINMIKKERTDYDKKIYDNYIKQKSLKNLFIKNE
ncbi:MAG: hypothetical protein PHX34_00055 [Candidatus Shapirobacteria bacterium]|nr:hypothetical protein [Candidatus Shapirobacteria bacterium]